MRRRRWWPNEYNVHDKRVEVSNTWRGVSLFLFLFVSLGSGKIGSSSPLPRSSSSNNDTLFDLALLLLLLLGSAADHRLHIPNNKPFEIPEISSQFGRCCPNLESYFPIRWDISVCIGLTIALSDEYPRSRWPASKKSRIILGKSYSSKMSKI